MDSAQRGNSFAALETPALKLATPANESAVKFALTPIYDMLPMLFAPEHDQTPARVFDPPSPATDSLRAFARLLAR